jgi:hypothetical protein
MSSSFPRLLVASEFPPNASGGGPAIVRQALRDWPIEQLFWWSCFADSDRRFNQRVTRHRVAGFPPKSYPNRRFLGPKSWLLENVWTPWATHHFRQTMNQCTPDAIWVIPHCWSIPPLAQILPDGRIGFHTSMHDYVNNEAGIKRFGQSRCEKVARMADGLYAKATTRDAISESMMLDLRDRTGVDGNIVHAGLEEEDFDYLMTKKEPSSDAIRIAYAGTISVEPVFEIFVKTLSAIRSQLPKPVSLEFYGSHSYTTRTWFDPSWMSQGGNLTEPQLLRTLRSCTWGFVPMSLSAADPPHLFSLPTKFATYLSAGLPVITIGHAQSSLMQMTKKYRVGVSATSAEEETLREEFMLGLSLDKPWQAFGSEIFRCAQNEFDFRRSRQSLRESFLICAKQTRLKSP